MRVLRGLWDGYTRGSTLDARRGTLLYNRHSRRLAPPTPHRLSSLNKMVSFTDETIRSYPPFYELEQPVRERFIELLKTTEINDKGTFKRKSNGFLLFRKHCAELIKQQGQSGETQRTGMNQADFSKYVQEKWKDLTPAGREAWNKAHDAEVQEQLKLFPEYTYKPMPGPIWDSLYAEGKKRFWLDSVAAICRKLLDPSSAWKHLTVADWMRKNPANESLVDLEKYVVR